MKEAQEESRLWMAIGGVAPIGMAVLLVTVRSHVDNANMALVFVIVVVGIAAAGGSLAGAMAAVSSALSFDFFLTRPYLHLRISSSDDVETTALLLVVGLIVGNIAARARRSRRTAEAASDEIRRIRRVAALAATGDQVEDVMLAAETELTELLRLRFCRFEAPPFDSVLPRLERSGTIPAPDHHYRLRAEGFELPAGGVELPVLGRGQVLGRFVLEPTPGRGVSLEERVVAVAIADQVGAALAAPEPRQGTNHG